MTNVDYIFETFFKKRSNYVRKREETFTCALLIRNQLHYVCKFDEDAEEDENGWESNKNSYERIFRHREQLLT